MSVLTESGHTIFEPAALLLKDNLEALNPNFRINVVAVTETQFDEAFASTPFPYAMWFKNADAFRDPALLFKEYHHPDGNWGERLGLRNGYADPDSMAELIDAAEVETDPDTRFEMYQEIQQRVFDEPNWLWMAEEKNLQIYRCWVYNFQYNPMHILPRLRNFDKR